MLGRSDGGLREWRARGFKTYTSIRNGYIAMLAAIRGAHIAIRA